MDWLLVLIEQSPPAHWLRYSRWGYASVNTLHVLGIALLVGAIVPLDLRLLGWRPRLSIQVLAGLLLPTATGGLLLALVTGAWLFSSRASEYAGQPLFLLKLSLILLALGNALASLRVGTAQATPTQRHFFAGASLFLWLAVLFAGRWLGFVAG